MPNLTKQFSCVKLTLPFGPKPTKELSFSFVNCPYKLSSGANQEKQYSNVNCQLPI